MSKAFTRESDDSEEIPSVRPRLPPGTRNLITQEGADGLNQRLKALVERREKLIAGRSQAGTAPDAEQRKIEAAIRNLRQVLDSVVLAEMPVDREKVAFGATVKVRHGDGEEAEYRIVGVEEADPDRGWISWVSPVGRALLGRRAGEPVRFRTPAGEEELTIVAIG